MKLKMPFKQQTIEVFTTKNLFLFFTFFVVKTVGSIRLRLNEFSLKDRSGISSLNFSNLKFRIKFTGKFDLFVKIFI